MNMSSKGITPVIATVLLLMMTVSAAAGAYYWITSVQGNLQQSSETAIDSSGITGSYRISVLAGGITCTASSDDITVYVKNTGASDIPADNWYLFAKNTQGQGVGTWSNDSAVGVFNAGDTTSITFTLSAGTGLTANRMYTLQINPPKGTSANAGCTAE